MDEATNHRATASEPYADCEAVTDKQAEEVVATLPSIHGPPDRELQYILQMIAVAQDDIRHVFLYATASLGLAALAVTQVPLATIVALPWLVRVVLLVGIGSLAAASYLFFRYARAMHLNRMRMVRCIPTLYVVRVRELWAGKHSGWQRNKGRFHWAQGLMLLGVICVGTAIAFLVLGSQISTV
jgi:hypothetical protein